MRKITLMNFGEALEFAKCHKDTPYLIRYSFINQNRGGKIYLSDTNMRCFKLEGEEGSYSIVELRRNGWGVVEKVKAVFKNEDLLAEDYIRADEWDIVYCNVVE